MHDSLSPEIMFFQERPPRCIRAVARPAEASATYFLRTEYGDGCTVFGIRTDKPKPLWLRASGEGEHAELSPPYIIGTREAPDFTFDYRRDGYDGEMKHWEGHPDEESSRWVLLQCTSCKGERFEFTAAFQYAGEDEELEGEERKRAQDFFGWFALLANCSKCHETWVGDWECA